MIRWRLQTAAGSWERYLRHCWSLASPRTSTRWTKLYHSTAQALARDIAASLPLFPNLQGKDVQPQPLLNVLDRLARLIPLDQVISNKLPQEIASAVNGIHIFLKLDIEFCKRLVAQCPKFIDILREYSTSKRESESGLNLKIVGQCDFSLRQWATRNLTYKVDDADLGRASIKCPLCAGQRSWIDHALFRYLTRAWNEGHWENFEQRDNFTRGLLTIFNAWVPVLHDPTPNSRTWRKR